MTEAKRWFWKQKNTTSKTDIRVTFTRKIKKKWSFISWCPWIKKILEAMKNNHSKWKQMKSTRFECKYKKGLLWLQLKTNWVFLTNKVICKISSRNVFICTSISWQKLFCYNNFFRLKQYEKKYVKPTSIFQCPVKPLMRVLHCTTSSRKLCLCREPNQYIEIKFHLHHQVKLLIECFGLVLFNNSYCFAQLFWGLSAYSAAVLYCDL